MGRFNQIIIKIFALNSQKKAFVGGGMIYLMSVVIIVSVAGVKIAQDNMIRRHMESKNITTKRQNNNEMWKKLKEEFKGIQDDA